MTAQPQSKQAGSQTLLFCIGAQKAGTTWLQRQLESCPDVHFARPKELHYWDCIHAPYLQDFALRARSRLQAPQPSDPLRYRLSALWKPELRARKAQAERYASIYAAAPEDHAPYLSYLGLGQVSERMVGDITPSYALLGRASFADMLACHDDVRFVFIMRDPVMRLWSGVQQQYRGALASGQLTEEGLRRSFERVCLTPFDPNHRRSDYVATLTELEAVVPQDRIHYSFFETLLDAENGAAERDALAQFLEVPAEKFNAAQKVHGGSGRFALPSELHQHAREVFDPVYAELSERFADRIPPAWGAFNNR